MGRPRRDRPRRPARAPARRPIPHRAAEFPAEPRPLFRRLHASSHLHRRVAQRLARGRRLSRRALRAPVLAAHGEEPTRVAHVPGAPVPCGPRGGRWPDRCSCWRSGRSRSSTPPGRSRPVRMPQPAAVAATNDERQRAAPGGRALEHVSCNLCGSTDLRPVYSMPDARFPTSERFWVVECLHCGLGFVNPRPDPLEMAGYYPARVLRQSASRQPPAPVPSTGRVRSADRRPGRTTAIARRRVRQRRLPAIHGGARLGRDRGRGLGDDQADHRFPGLHDRVLGRAARALVIRGGHGLGGVGARARPRRVPSRKRQQCCARVVCSCSW